MHKYLRAIGFTDLTDAEFHRFIWKEVIQDDNISSRVETGGGAYDVEYRLRLNEKVGLSALVSFIDDIPNLRYYYPYYNTYDYVMEGVCTIEGHIMTDTYSGVLEDMDTGLSLIFFLNNPMDYRRRSVLGDTMDYSGVALSAFSNEGIVILPVVKNEDDLSQVGIDVTAELEDIFDSDDEDVDILTAEDFSIYDMLSDRMETEDLYSVVAESLMPCGVECDQYSVIGDILDIEESSNVMSGEKLWFIHVSCNDAVFYICMRQADLTGEPLRGRRIKCRIWMQGNVKTFV